MDKEQRLTIRDLMNYLYCPRIIYFEHVVKIPQVTTKKEHAGRKTHEIFSQKTKRNKIISDLPRLRKIYDVGLTDAELGFHTVLDCVAIDDTKNMAYPIEVKNSTAPRMMYRTQKFQLIAEAYLIERVLGFQAKRAYIKYMKSNDWISYDIPENSKEKLVMVINSIKRILESEQIPEPTEYKKRCVDCCFFKICRRI